MTETVTAREAGELLAFGRDAAQAVSRFRRWQQQGILPSATRDPGGATAAFRFDRAQIAMAAVLWWLYDRTGLTNRDMLKALYANLAGFSFDPEDNSARLIDLILTDVAADGSPVLVVTQWQKPGGVEPVTTFVVRLTGELDRPIIAPSHEHEPIFDGVLSLAPLLAPFIESNVVPLRKREA